MIGRSKQVLPLVREKGSQAGKPFGERMLKVAREFCSKKPSLYVPIPGHAPLPGTADGSTGRRGKTAADGTVISLSSPERGILVVPRSIALRPIDMDEGFFSLWKGRKRCWH